ncbi:hypothetical protein CH63R_11779 [Colletotrichum higginsianum IMI 349063]|uniref:Uncharacterized protein n=1 Tax=Colletotrichum higginsianum (strain IMI 349063) TaxID=759273 RepID=A0A1B7XZ88_COLHI|nr:hypothetical protein CH63R_11779 [Colletotrichum higginsianum IMI 349063]OBR05076.1 hypothetical protein CH63R_11779 [Colletotrichum higginsianum IMI 349063]
MLHLWAEIKKQLRDVKNPLYTGLLGTDQWGETAHLIMRTMNVRDEQCLRIMASMIKDSRASLNDFAYWEDMGRTADMPNRGSEDERNGVPCSVM